MTIFIADVASYQAGLTFSQLQAAGFTGINLKISDGITMDHVHPSVRQWAADAVTAGWGVSTFHYLRGTASGMTQAGYAYARLLELHPLALTTFAHVVDVEDPYVTEAIFTEYVSTMAMLIGPFTGYTGDWYADSRPWLKASANLPWLWSAPNRGYLDEYPGDKSADWSANYNGWTDLAAMQYAVKTISGVRVSHTAIRSTDVWASMRGVPVAVSQNGWTVDFTGDLQDNSAVHGVTFPNGVRRGDVATVLFYVADQFHRTVEPLVPGWSWGWFVKQILGSTSYSNHSSGTAIDLNAPNHPLGSSGTFSSTKVTAIRKILSYCGGVVRWGGDYTTRKDEMHFEIDKDAAAVAALAAKIRGENFMEQADKDWIVSELEKRLGGIQIYNADGTPAEGKTMGSRYALGIISRDAGAASRAASLAISKLEQSLQALAVENAEVPPTSQENAQAVLDVLATANVATIGDILINGLSYEARQELAAILAAGQ